MPAPVLANEFPGHGTKENSKPRPFEEPQRGGHPEKLNRFLGVDVLERGHPSMFARQQENTRKGVPPACTETVHMASFLQRSTPLLSPPQGGDMSNFGIEITEIVIKELVRRILEEYAKTGRYVGDSWTHQYSIFERRCGLPRGVAHRQLPDPNLHQRRKTDFDSKSKAA